MNAVSLFVEPHGNSNERLHVHLSLRPVACERWVSDQRHHVPISGFQTSDKKFNSRFVAPTIYRNQPFCKCAEGFSHCGVESYVFEKIVQKHDSENSTLYNVVMRKAFLYRSLKKYQNTLVASSIFSSCLWSKASSCLQAIESVRYGKWYYFNSTLAPPGKGRHHARGNGGKGIGGRLWHGNGHFMQAHSVKQSKTADS